MGKDKYEGMPRASRVKIIKPDGTVEYQKALPSERQRFVIGKAKKRGNRYRGSKGRFS